MHKDNDKPMKEPKEGESWYLKDGSLFTWIAGEHFLVLVGFSSITKIAAIFEFMKTRKVPKH